MMQKYLATCPDFITLAPTLVATTAPDPVVLDFFMLRSPMSNFTNPKRSSMMNPMKSLMAQSHCGPKSMDNPISPSSHWIIPLANPWDNPLIIHWVGKPNIIGAIGRFFQRRRHAADAALRLDPKTLRHSVAPPMVGASHGDASIGMQKIASHLSMTVASLGDTGYILWYTMVYYILEHPFQTFCQFRDVRIWKVQDIWWLYNCTVLQCITWCHSRG